MRLELALAVLSVIVLSGCSGTSGSMPGAASASSVPAPDPPVNVTASAAEVGDLERRLDLTGTVTPDLQVTLYAKTTGYLKSIHVDIGDPVARGQLLAELEIPEMDTELSVKKAAVLKASAALEQARATIEKSRAEAEFARLNHERLKRIHDRDADLIAEQEVDQARASLGVALSSLKAAEANERSAQAALAAVEADLGSFEELMRYARITAPMSGVVTERFVDPGALIQAASSSRTQAAPIVSIARIDRVRIVADVPEASASNIRRGSRAAVRFERDGAPVAAAVARISKIINPASRTMRIEIDLPNPRERIRPGMTARVSLQTEMHRRAVTVPATALHNNGSDRVVYVARQGVAHAVRVTTGAQSEDRIQLTSGVNGGDRVITESSGALKDGIAIEVRR